MVSSTPTGSGEKRGVGPSRQGRESPGDPERRRADDREAGLAAEAEAADPHGAEELAGAGDGANRKPLGRD